MLRMESWLLHNFGLMERNEESKVIVDLGVQEIELLGVSLPTDSDVVFIERLGVVDVHLESGAMKANPFDQYCVTFVVLQFKFLFSNKFHTRFNDTSSLSRRRKMIIYDNIIVYPCFEGENMVIFHLLNIC